MNEEPTSVETIELGGATYRVALTLGAVKRLKDATGKDLLKGENPFGTEEKPELDVELAIRFFHAILAIPKGEERPSEDEVADWIEVTEVPKMMEAMMDIMARRMPEATEAAPFEHETTLTGP